MHLDNAARGARGLVVVRDFGHHSDADSASRRAHALEEELSHGRQDHVDPVEEHLGDDAPGFREKPLSAQAENTLRSKHGYRFFSALAQYNRREQYSDRYSSRLQRHYGR